MRSARAVRVSERGLRQVMREHDVELALPLPSKLRRRERFEVFDSEGDRLGEIVAAGEFFTGPEEIGRRIQALRC